MRTDVRADAQATTELSAQLTAFMRTDVRAGAQTSTELTAQFTTFMTTDVRADAQTNIELTAQLATDSTTESTAQLIQKPIMRVCINDLERPRKLDVSVTFGGHSATMAKEQHRSDSAALVPCSLRLEPTRRNNHSMNHSATHPAITAKEHHRSGVGKRSQAAVVAKQMLWLLLNISATELTAQSPTESTTE